MSLLSPAGQSLALNAVHGAITHISLHTATPGTSGASEATGGGYARQPVGTTPFTTSSAGSAVTNNNALSFTTNGTTAITDAGAWTALTSGTYEFGWHLGASVTAASITVAASALSSTAS